MKQNDHQRLLELAYQEVFGVSGKTLGSPTHWYQGVHSPDDGVQWHFVIDRLHGFTRIGVNLEGLSYGGTWPIARFIERELESPQLLKFRTAIPEADHIYIYWQRDAWQVTTRPLIIERVIGGRESTLKELTEENWRALLLEVNDCLDRSIGKIRRSVQTVTLKKSGPREMQVSPHFMLHMKLWHIPPSSLQDAVVAIKEKIELMEPLYGYVLSRSS